MKKPIPFGKYLLLERVNVGGMAEVFKAKAFGVEGFERLVAVKRILPSIAEDQEFITMFIDEAKISVQLTHANIASIFDLGKVNESYFIALEYVRGKDMRAIFDRLASRGAAVPVPMASYVVMKVCEGLDYAHNKRDAGGQPLHLVHRDVSPQNVLVSYDGEIKLIDFGIAKAANKAGKTQAGILKGKFGYMSPEQVRGLPLDRRSDIFAVGIVLYELLTGERLFVGESDFSTLEKVRNVEIMPPRTYNRKIPEELEQIVLKALAKDVEDRYQTAMDLHDDLQSFMYTSGNFFARKDLGAWQRKMWTEEILKEEARDDHYRKIKAPKKEPSRPPAPPRVSTANPPPPPPPPRPRRPKPTMMGVGAPAFPPKAPPSAPPKTAPVAPAFDMDWDEDAEATQIYDKPEESAPIIGGGNASPFDAAPTGPPSLGQVGAPGLGQASLSHGDLAGVETQVPSGRGAPSPFDAPRAPTYDAGEPAPFGDPAPYNAPAPFDGGAPAPFDAPAPREPTMVTRQPEEKRKTLPILIAAAAIALAVIVWGLWPANPGTVQLVTVPSDPVVLFDEVPVQATASPFVITNVEPGFHQIDVRKTGYETWSTQIEVQPGQSLQMPTVTLSPLEDSTPAADTGFALTTTPPGATVFVDGRELADRTPMRVTDLSVGSHTVRAELAGQDWQQTITVTAGSMLTLENEWAAAEILVRFRSDPEDAEVVLVRGDERVTVGRTPTHQDVDVSGGAWTVEMSRRGYEDWSGPLAVLEGRSSATVSADLEQSAGAVRMNNGRNNRNNGRNNGRNNIRNNGGRDTNSGGRDTNSGGDTNNGGRDTNNGGSTMTPDDPPPRGGNGTVNINTRPWSEVFIDGRRVGNTPQMGLSLSAGRHRIRFVNPDLNISETESITVRSGETLRVIRRFQVN